jgi:hypothetical protein
MGLEIMIIWRLPSILMPILAPLSCLYMLVDKLPSQMISLCTLNFNRFSSTASLEGIYPCSLSGMALQQR